MSQKEPLRWRQLLPPRDRLAHKGNFGHVLVIGGNYGMGGAVRLASEATIRVGAGLVSVVTRPEHVTLVNTGCPELICYGVRSHEKHEKTVNALYQRATVVAIGPGLGLSAWSRSLLKQALATAQPEVVDADALNLLAKQSYIAPRNDWILTPHPGEAARLLNTQVAVVQANRQQAACDLQQKLGGIIILKGAASIVVHHTLIPFVCQAGNPGMASGGMGGVLTGIIAGLLSQGLAPYDAATCVVYLHAHAGDLAAQEGERGLLASDLFPFLRRLVNP